MWRIFSFRPLWATLAGGKIWRWFALNIPMDLMTGGMFTSDIDIIAKVQDYPRSQEWLYKTWEVKVSLLCKDGTARSLKAGKTERTVTQLKAYREFGSPEVSLLDCYICETGFASQNPFPPTCLHATLREKIEILRRERFGYQLLPFEHDRNVHGECEFATYASPRNPLQKTFNLVPAVSVRPEQPFSRLVDRLNDFFENLGRRPRKPFCQIAFCRDCRRLQLIDAKTDACCPDCEK